MEYVKYVPIIICGLMAIYIVAWVLLMPTVSRLMFKRQCTILVKTLRKWYKDDVVILGKNMEGVTSKITRNGYTTIVNIFPYLEAYKVTISNDLKSDSYIFDTADGRNLHKILNKYIK